MAAQTIDNSNRVFEKRALRVIKFWNKMVVRKICIPNNFLQWLFTKIIPSIALCKNKNKTKAKTKAKKIQLYYL